MCLLICYVGTNICEHKPNTIPVCGSGGRSYHTRCEFEEAYKSNRKLYIVKNGPCDNYRNDESKEIVKLRKTTNKKEKMNSKYTKAHFLVEFTNNYKYKDVVKLSNDQRDPTWNKHNHKGFNVQNHVNNVNMANIHDSHGHGVHLDDSTSDNYKVKMTKKLKLISLKNYSNSRNKVFIVFT